MGIYTDAAVIDNMMNIAPRTLTSSSATKMIMSTAATDDFTDMISTITSPNLISGTVMKGKGRTTCPAKGTTPEVTAAALTCVLAIASCLPTLASISITISIVGGEITMGVATDIMGGVRGRDLGPEMMTRNGNLEVSGEREGPTRPSPLQTGTA